MGKRDSTTIINSPTKRRKQLTLHQAFTQTQQNTTQGNTQPGVEVLPETNVTREKPTASTEETDEQHDEEQMQAEKPTATLEETEEQHEEQDIIEESSEEEPDNQSQDGETAKDNIENESFEFIKNKFQLVNNSSLSQLLDSTASQLSSMIKSVREPNLKTLLFKVLQDEFWDKLVEVVNKNFIDEKTTKGTKNKYYNSVTKKNLFAFLGMLIELEMEHTKMDDNAGVNFTKIKERKKLDTIGSNKFFAILNNIGPNENDLQEILSLLNDSFCICVELGIFVCVDETVWSYIVRKLTQLKAEKEQKPIPVVYIPRKPKPNGLMCYKACTKLAKSGKTFILVMIPHSTIPQITASQALFKAVHHLRKHFSHQFHVTCDSAFASFDTMTKLKQLNVLSTFSMCSNESKWMWSLMKRKLYQGQWKAFKKDQEILLSVYHNPNDDEHRYHHLATNLFKATSKGYEFQENSGGKYSKRYLASKTVKELKTICAKESIKHGSLAKPKLIDKIFKICNGVNSQLKEFTSDIETFQFKERPLHHDLYRETFNFVDKQNKYFYKNYYSYIVKNWRSKMMISIFTDTFYNFRFVL